MFHKKHYERIARVIRDGIRMERLRYNTNGDIVVDYTITNLVEDFVSMFKMTSSNFNETKFITACMSDEEE